jgi:hypothetical protein
VSSYATPGEGDAGDARGLLAADVVDAGGEDGVVGAPGVAAAIPGRHGGRGWRGGLGTCGSLDDDAVDVGEGLSLGGEAGLDEAAQEVEERLDASEGFGPEADLGGGWEGDGVFFEEEVGSEGGALGLRERTNGGGLTPLTQG